ncbi:retron Eco8 family effector endonuclease [Ruminococcus flavefaciens]|uniref:Predicted ATP-dependent endonuclease of the OLD family, contains P-loop ATPase and TOPRIM domains n=1 Tax=Ruminococcus flavefaciens TaxID=1265 RepID=A0A1M7IFB6_RUMFL|nr:retron Eco8 family effector endonuclease [Ruminococcus flavefaciens]SHM39506.1 Predicted ATP-dependent endonuclease of the OLD family, contains P-loop ATPase and TOPRIM domains [Ruminococcus flavefaciens]
MIEKIIIKNFKSIKDVTFDFRDNHENILCLLGKNGSGKTNITKAILYFWEHLCDDFSSNSICDSVNPYNQTAEITVSFDISLLRRKAQNNSKLKEEIDYIDKKIGGDSFLNPVNSIEIKMIQNKNGNIIWSDADYNIRKTIKKCFPVYLINTRSLDIYTWEKIWNIISDISMTKPKVSDTEIIDSLNLVFEKIFGSKYLDVEKALSEIFEKQKISFDKYHFDSKFKSAFAMRFGGNIFQFDKMSLDFYSEGTNSYKYLLLFLELVSKVTAFSSKYPIILLDEPEIGMHPNYIYEFVRCVCDNIPGNALLFMNTHSPELIKDIIKTISDTGNTNSFSLYQVSYNKRYSIMRKMNTKFLFINKEIISLNETECYFYDAIVYVEGKTEMQLFNNYYLRLVFPKLRQVCFYLSGSDNVNLQNVSVENINLGSKFKFLVDMDKIISYNKTSERFVKKTRETISPLIDESKLKRLNYGYYENKPISKKQCIDKIELLLKNKYTYKKNTHYIEDNDFSELMKMILWYCRNENCIVNWSTIEGELITYENIDKFILFLNGKSISKNKVTQHNGICKIADYKEKTVLILAEMNGKTETQEGTKNSKVQYQGNDLQKDLLDKKTSGWVGEWLEYYYKNYLYGKIDQRVIFEKDFPSLYKTLQIIENMV